MKCQTRLSLCSLFLGYANLSDLSFAAPCVDFCLKNLIKMRASPCLSLSRNQFLISLTQFQMQELNTGLFRRLELPISKKPRKQSHLGVNYAFAHFRRVWKCLTFGQSHPLTSQKCPCGFQVQDFKASLCPFSETHKNFSTFFL